MAKAALLTLALFYCIAMRVCIHRNNEDEQHDVTAHDSNDESRDDDVTLFDDVTDAPPHEAMLLIVESKEDNYNDPLVPRYRLSRRRRLARRSSRRRTRRSSSVRRKSWGAFGKKYKHQGKGWGAFGKKDQYQGKGWGAFGKRDEYKDVQPEVANNQDDKIIPREISMDTKSDNTRKDEQEESRRREMGKAQYEETRPLGARKDQEHIPRDHEGKE